MIKLDVLRLLEERGKTKYWLYKQLGMSYQNFNKMVNNQTKDRKSTRLNSSHVRTSRMPSSA